MKIINSIQLSEQLLLAMKMEKSSVDEEAQLATYPFDLFQQELSTDEAKKAFWINCYNAYFLILRKVKKLEKPAIYRNKEIEIAGNHFSLDDIEHGILRKYRYKPALGYLPNWLAPKLIKNLAVDKMDYRIHFALNCGAASCPPIAFYTPEKIEEQLEMATQSFLEPDTQIDSDKKEIHISQLFKWFLGDFGGKSGIRKILEKQLGIDTSRYQLIYKPYSWEEKLDNYAEF